MRKLSFLFSVFLLINGIVNAQINQYHDDGTRHGVWEKKFEGRDQVRYSGQFDHGKEVGDFRFYSKGLEGHPTAIKTFSENGTKAEVKFYTQSGKLISKGIEINKKKEGKWEYYHNTNSKLMTVENYVNGELDGEQITYYDNGQVSETINYVDGKKQGKQLVYSVKGVLIKEFTYANGELNGVNKFFSGRGVLTIEGMYKNDKKNGYWKYYDNAGNFVREKKYE